MNNRGKLVILGILLVAVAASLFAVYYQYRSQDHALDLWGTTSARLIASSPQVEVLLLGEETDVESEPAADAPARVESGDQAWRVAASHDAVGAKGIANVRRALVMDTTYDWAVADSLPPPVWKYAMTFSDGKDWATVLFDFDTGQVALTGSRKTGRLNRMASDDLAQFFVEQLATAPAEPDAAEMPAREAEPPAAESPEAGATAPPADEAVPGEVEPTRAEAS
jgi:hypothetical protein